MGAGLIVFSLLSFAPGDIGATPTRYRRSPCFAAVDSEVPMQFVSTRGYPHHCAFLCPYFKIGIIWDVWVTIGGRGESAKCTKDRSL